MKLITYSIKNTKYYRNNKEISEQEIKQDLGGDRFRKLKRNKEIKVRYNVASKNNPNLIENKTNKKKNNKSDKVYEKYRSLYKIDHTKYRTGIKIELWRKNIRYGYYNFVTYLESDNEEYIKEKIILDIEDQKLKENQKKKSNIIDNDI